MLQSNRLEVFAFLEECQARHPVCWNVVDVLQLTYLLYLLVPYALVHVEGAAVGQAVVLAGEVQELVVCFLSRRGVEEEVVAVELWVVSLDFEMVGLCHLVVFNC